MISNSGQLGAWLQIPLEKAQLRKFIISHLNRIYSAKLHLTNRLPMLLKHVQFSVLESAIVETVEDVEKQLARMELIYALMDRKISKKPIKGLSGLIEDAFYSIEKLADQDELCDLSIIFYLQNIKSVEMSSFQILQMAAAKLSDKQVVKLLNENYQEAKADRVLFLQISTKYVVSAD
ncbi:DUF892 family protein [Pedobacter sp. Leaf132]|uniref:DUF892 family protein n=1 Tax=Pedobacter sp. Leaf132 TaxID=2876557 RepID=UPI001E4A07E2|nr:DUF892 family protein [Pedobacter sp. Leaf132]